MVVRTARVSKKPIVLVRGKTNRERPNNDSLVKIQRSPDHGADQADQDEHGQREINGLLRGGGPSGRLRHAHRRNEC